MGKKVTVSADGRSVVTRGSGGKAISSLPDVCGIPTPNGRVDIPFVNVCDAQDLVGGSVTVTIGGESVALMGSKISKSTGDEAGVLGGVMSGSTGGEGVFIMGSQTVFIEGRPVIRKGDMMLMNNCNTLSMSGMMQDDVENPDDLTMEKGTIEISLEDDEGNPIPDERYIIKHSNGQTEEGRLDSKGYAKVEKVSNRTYKIKFPDLEEDEKA